MDMFDNLGFDSEELKEHIFVDTLIQRIWINEKGVNKEYVVIKSSPQSVEDAPQRKAVRQNAFFDEYRHCKPEEYYQYTVMLVEKANELLRRHNELLPQVSSSLPYVPENLDSVDKYTIDRVHRLLSGGFNITIYLHPTLRHFFIPSQDFMTPKREELLNTCEIISTALRLPIFDIVSADNFEVFKFKPLQGWYEVYDHSSMGNGRMDRIIASPNQIVFSNPSIYNRAHGLEN